MKNERDYLEELNVHCLRIIGREAGVKAPATLRKKILIEEIVAIQSGEKQPAKPTNKGRPIKNFVTEMSAEEEKEIIDRLTIIAENEVKKKFIAYVLSEVEKKLNEIL